MNDGKETDERGEEAAFNRIRSARAGKLGAGDADALVVVVVVVKLRLDEDTADSPFRATVSDSVLNCTAQPNKDREDRLKGHIYHKQ